MAASTDFPLDLNLISIFVNVVEAGSFTAAAAQLGLPKSSVSRAVSRLEESLGVRLLQRTTRRLGLTPAGDRYLAEVRRPLTQLSEASKDTADLGKDPRGLVRISIPPELGEGEVSNLIVDFVRRYPKIQIDVVVTNRRVSLVDEGFDLAVRAGRLEDSTLIARKVAVSDGGLFASPKYLERRGQPRRLRDLTEHDCVLHRSAVGILPWRLSGPRGLELVNVSGPVTVDDLGSARLLTVAGLGIALMPEVVVRTEVESGALVRVLPAYALRGGGMYVVSPPLRHVPVRVSLFRDHLVAGLSARYAGTPCAATAAATTAATAASVPAAPATGAAATHGKAAARNTGRQRGSRTVRSSKPQRAPRAA